MPFPSRPITLPCQVNLLLKSLLPTLLGATLLKASTFVEIDYATYAQTFGGVAEITRNGDLLKRTVHGPGATRFATDGIAVYRLSRGSITQGPFGQRPEPFWSAPGAAVDLFLAGRELIIIREGLPVLRVDRFTGASVGEIHGTEEAADFQWELARGGEMLVGIRETASGLEFSRIRLGPIPGVLAKVAGSYERAVSTDPWLVPDRSGRKIWLPDGTLRDLDQGSILLDTGTTIDAACHFSLDSGAVSKGTTLSLHGYEGTLIATYPMPRPARHLSAQAKAVWAIGTNAIGTLVQFHLPPTASRPFLTGPNVGTHYKLVDSHLLDDGRFLFGNTGDDWGVVFDPEQQDFHDPFPLPRSGHLHPSSDQSRLAYTPHTTSAFPHLADFDRFPQWESTLPGGDMRIGIFGRLTTPHGFIVALHSDRRTVIAAIDFETGQQTHEFGGQGLNVRQAAWDHESQMLVSIDGSRTVNRFVHAGDGAFTRLEQISLSSASPAVTPSSFLRLKPGGRVACLQKNVCMLEPSGEVFEFEEPVMDAAWVGDRLFTLRSDPEQDLCVVEERGGVKFQVMNQQALAGSPEALRERDGTLWVIHQDVSRRYHFTRLDPDLQWVDAPPKAVRMVRDPVLTQITNQSVTFSWTPPASYEAAVVAAEYREKSKIFDYAWKWSACVAPEAGHLTIDGLRAGKEYEVRLTSGLAGQRPRTGNFVVNTLTGVANFDGNLNGLTISRDLEGTIQLEWRDLFDGESGYRVTITAPDGASTSIDLPADSESYTHASALPDTSYNYSITPLAGDLPKIPSAPLTYHSSPIDTANGIVLGIDQVVSMTTLEILTATQNTWRYIVIERTDEVTGETKRLAILPPDAQRFVDPHPPFNHTLIYRAHAGTAEGEILGSPRRAFPLDNPRLALTRLSTAKDGVFYQYNLPENRIDRFDLTSGVWIEALPIGFSLDGRDILALEDRVALSTGDRVIEVPLDGSSSRVVYEGPHDDFLDGGDGLHIAAPGRLERVDPISTAVTTTLETQARWITPTRDPRRFYGGDQSYLFEFHRITPDSYISNRHRWTGYLGRERALHYWAHADLMLSPEGGVYLASEPDPKVATLPPWISALHPDPDLLLLQTDSQLLLVDTSLTTLTTVDLAPHEFTTVIHAGKLWIFGQAETDEEIWTSRSIELASLTDRAEDDGPRLLDPAITSFDREGRLWFLDPNGLPTIMQADGHASALPDGEDGIWIALEASPDGASIALLGVADDLSTFVRVVSGDAPHTTLAEFQVAPDARDLRFLDQGPAVLASEGYSVHGLDGSVLEQSRDAAVLTMDSLASTQGRLELWRKEYASWQLTNLNASGSVVFEIELRDTLPVRRPILSISPDGSRAFSWPGGLHELSPDAPRVHVGAVKPIDSCWDGEQLLVLDHPLRDSTWLVAYDGASGEERFRYRVPADSFRILSDAEGFLIAHVTPAGTPGFLKLDASGNPATAGHGRPPELVWRRDQADGLEGFRLDLHPEIEGEGPMTFTWKKDGVAIPGQTSPRLEIAAATPADSGLYQLVANNSSGQATSGELQVEVRPLANLSSRIGNVITVAEDQLVELLADATLQTLAEVPESPDPAMQLTLGPDGRIHLLGRQGWLGPSVLDTFDPASASWRQLILPVSNRARNSDTYGLAIDGTRIRCQDLWIDTASGIMTRSDSRLYRSYGDLWTTSAGLETRNGELIRSELPLDGVLANGWFASSLSSEIAPGKGGMLLGEMTTGRLTFMEVPYVAAKRIRAGGPSSIVARFSQGFLRIDTRDHSYQEFALTTSHDFHVVGSTAASPFPDTAFSPTVRRYLNYPPSHFSAKYGMPFDQLVLDIPDPFVLPDELLPNGETPWSRDTAPYDFEDIGGFPPSPCGCSRARPVPIRARREGDDLVFRFLAPTGPDKQLLSEIEFSEKGGAWSGTLPSNATLELYDSYWYLTLTPGEDGHDQLFFRFRYPESPFESP